MAMSTFATITEIILLHRTAGIPSAHLGNSRRTLPTHMQFNTTVKVYVYMHMYTSLDVEVCAVGSPHSPQRNVARS